MTAQRFAFSDATSSHGLTYTVLMTNREIKARSLPLVLLFSLSLLGCGSDTGTADSVRVVLLGDATRAQALSALSEKGLDSVSVSTPPASSSIMEVADAAMNADFALVVTDATQGPTPIVREHIILARQLRIPTAGLLLSNTDTLLAIMEGDRELHELVELEIRELMNTYELGGDTAPVFFDSDTFDSSAGPTAFARALASGSYPRRTQQALTLVSGSILDCEIYLLSEPEAPTVRAITPKSSVSIWIDGQRASGEADLEALIRPGDATALRIRFASELTSARGARFFIERSGQLVGVGTVIALES